jgi:type IV pilus assembly protein PilO
MTKTKQWTIGAALAAALVLVAGFMLLVQPQRSEAALLKEQTVEQQAQADALRTKLNQLKVQEKDLPRQQARLAQIRNQIPETPALPSLIRSLTVAADSAGAEMITLSPSPPVDLAPPAAGGAPAGSVQPAEAVGSAVGARTLKQIPVTMQVVGSYAALTQFVTQLEGLQRSMLITDVAISIEGAEQAEPGELTLNLGAAVFMTAEQAAVEAVVPTPNPAADAAVAE